MSVLPYTIVVEPTDDPAYWSFFSPDLGGYTGSGTSFEDCVHNALAGIPEYLAFLREIGEDPPPFNPRAVIRLYDPEGLDAEDRQDAEINRAAS